MSVYQESYHLPEFDYDYEKLLEEHADSILGEYIRSMRKKEPGVCTAKALEYGVNALLGYDC